MRIAAALAACVVLGAGPAAARTPAEGTEGGAQLDAPPPPSATRSGDGAEPSEGSAGEPPASYREGWPAEESAPSPGPAYPAPAPGRAGPEASRWQHTDTEEIHRPNAITGDLFAQAVHYERGVLERLSLYGGIRTFAFLVGRGAREEDTFGVGPEAGIRIFFSGRAPEGFWVAPQGGIGLVRSPSAFGIENGLGWWAGGLAGYTWVFPSGFVLSLGAGAEFVDLELEAPDGTVGVRKADALFRLGLGWAF